MSRTCTVCAHPNRDEIEVLLVKRSGSYRDIAGQFALSKTAVARHVNEGHIAERLLRAHVDEEARGALDVTRQLKAINAAAGKILREAMEAQDEGGIVAPGLALRASDRILRQLELQAKLLGDLEERHVVELHMHPEWAELQALIVEALRPHPEARRAVIRVLTERN